MLSKKYNKSSSGVWMREESFHFDYSDGDEIENRLLKQIQEADDVSLASNELQRLMVDWPSEYHFSPLRANLLSPFHLNQFGNILEIGSGCGAITRVLGEQCPDSNIVALEGSLRRAEITRARCRDLENVTVCRDSFTDFENAGFFDLITMIGVLEYSPSFFEGDSPILAALNHARSLLSTNGALVVAMENQLGLKYFNGCAEDHNGQPFFGINDQYQPGTFCTFGREQLRKQLVQAGFERVEFVYPFPDYKLPQLLLREESFLCDDLDISHLPGQYPSRDYGREGDKIFNEARVWNVLSQNGLIRDLANSFLVFAFPGDGNLSDITDPWLVKAFSGRRKKRYLIETEFHKEQDEIVVEKKACYPLSSEQSPDEQETVIHHLEKMEYLPGVPYGYTLLDQVSKEDSLAQFIIYLTPWMEWLRANALPQSGSESDEKLLLPGRLFDCMPANFLVNKKKELCLIDQEWEYKAPLELGVVFFRGIYREVNSNLEYFEQTDMFRNRTIRAVFDHIYTVFDLPFDQEVFSDYLDSEVTFQLEVGTYNVGRKGLTEYLHTFFNETRTVKSGFAELLTSGGIGRHTQLLEQEKVLSQAVIERDEQITVLNQFVAERDENLSAIAASLSWRLTAPLRFAGYVLRGDFENASRARSEIQQGLRKGSKRFVRLLLSGISRILKTETDSKANHLALEAIVAERCAITRDQPLFDPLSALPPEVLPEVDITVVTFNSQKWVVGFVDSLILLDYPKSLLTICFVDNDSTDATVDTLQKEALRLKEAGYTVKILRHENCGYGAGHNRAIQEGSAPFCLISNIDLTFDVKALQAVVSMAVADDEKASAWELRQKPYEHPKFYDPVTGTTNWNSHACVLLRRRSIEQLNGYDETLFMYGEDVELSYRLRRSGALLRYSPDAVVHHYSYDEAGQIKPLQYSGSTFANLYLRLKYGCFKDICAIPFLVTQLLLAPEPYPGSRHSVMRNLLRLLVVSPRTLRRREKAVGKAYFPFYTWDYELVREGAFVEQSALPSDTPLVTVITRTFKGRELYLRQALLSVAHQTYPNIEHIIVEDGSASLKSVVEQIGQLTGRPAKYHSIAKLGRSVAGNTGLENSTGRWCLFLDDDDLLFSGHVEVLVAALLEQKKAVAAYSLSWEVFTDEAGGTEGEYTENRYITPDFVGGEYDYKTLEHHNYMAIQSVLFERRLFEERGGLDSDLDTLEDWVLWLCYGYGNQFVYVPKVTSLFRTPSGGTVRNTRQDVIDSGYENARNRARSRIDALGLKNA